MLRLVAVPRRAASSSTNFSKYVQNVQARISEARSGTSTSAAAPKTGGSGASRAASGKESSAGGAKSAPPPPPKPSATGDSTTSTSGGASASSTGGASSSSSTSSTSSSSSSSSASSAASSFAATGLKFASQLKSAVASGELLRAVRGSVSETRQAVIDVNASRYGGLTSKAYRNRIREARMGGAKAAASSGADSAPTAEDPNAGANVVLHKDSRWREAWTSFKDSNPMVQGVFSMRRRYEESDSTLANTARLLSDRLRDLFGPMFEETEHAAAIAEIREIDPSFSVESFVKDAREFMIPEILEAYIDWDPATLKHWVSDSVFNILEMSREVDIERGHTIDGRLLDLRNVELAMAKMMEDTPILILSFKTQQTEVVRDATGAVVTGSPDQINDVYYIFACTKDLEKPNPLTRGWKVVEMAIQGVRESI